MSRQQLAHSTQKHHSGHGVILSAVCCLLCAGGCGPPANPEQLREEILKADPSFSDVLQKRDEQANRIKLLEREYDLKRTQADEQIEKLRKELKDARVQVDQKIQRGKALLKPDIDRVELAIVMATEERQAKRNQRASLGRSINQRRKALKQEHPPFSEADRGRMEREARELVEETQRIDHEIAALNEHLRLLKIKRILLRL